MKRIKLMMGLAAIAISAISSQATLLPLVSTGVAPSAYVPGAFAVLDTLVSPYSQPTVGPVVFSGTVTSRVVSDPANPLGGLSFWYTIANTGVNPVEGFSLGGFLGILADVGYIAGPGTDPSAASRAAGDPLHWSYLGFLSGIIPGGGAGDTLVVNTAATGWGRNVGSIQDTYSQNVNILAVPEPTTVIAGALLLLPFGASTLRFIRRNRGTV